MEFSISIMWFCWLDRSFSPVSICASLWSALLSFCFLMISSVADLRMVSSMMRLSFSGPGRDRSKRDWFGWNRARFSDRRDWNREVFPITVLKILRTGLKEEKKRKIEIF